MTLEEIGRAFDQHRRNVTYINTILESLSNPNTDDDRRTENTKELDDLRRKQAEIERSLMEEGFGEYIP